MFFNNAMRVIFIRTRFARGVRVPTAHWLSIPSTCMDRDTKRELERACQKSESERAKKTEGNIVMSYCTGKASVCDNAPRFSTIKTELI